MILFRFVFTSYFCYYMCICCACMMSMGTISTMHVEVEVQHLIIRIVQQVPLPIELSYCPYPYLLFKLA